MIIIIYFSLLKKPFHTATKQTLSWWIKKVLNDSGVDTSISKSHSTRHVSTSLASIKGINQDEIRKAAGWSANPRKKLLRSLYTIITY